MLERTFERAKLGWSMARSAIGVVRRHPTLLVFPVLSGLALLALLATILLPGVLPSVGRQLSALNQGQGNGVGLLALVAAYYLSLWFIMVFFNAALVFSVLRAFETGRASLGEGLAMAAYRLPQILGWTLVAATVGVILSAITSALKERAGILGSFVGSLFEAAWAVLTYFAVPALVVEGVGPIRAVRRSGEIMRRTWGESLGGEFGLGLVGLVLSLPLLVLMAVLWATAPGPEVVGGGAALGTPLVLLIAAYAVAVTIVLSTLSTVLRSALYMYAANGQLPPGFDEGALAGAFQSR